MVFTERKSLGAAQVSIRIQALAAAVSVVAAVALPQILHVVGASFGLGSTLGEMLLPMHLPIILVGLLAGPGWRFGWVSGAAGEFRADCHAGPGNASVYCHRTLRVRSCCRPAENVLHAQSG